MIEVSLNELTTSATITKLVNLLQDRTPLMKAAGETMQAIVNQSFLNSASPAGVPWKENSPVTILKYMQVINGGHKKNGIRTQNGLAKLGSKKPLIGRSGELSKQFHLVATADSITINSAKSYAAIQQYGAKKQALPYLWGDIPARPFLPINAQGDLMPQAEQALIRTMQEYLNDFISRV